MRCCLLVCAEKSVHMGVGGDAQPVQEMQQAPKTPPRRRKSKVRVLAVLQKILHASLPGFDAPLSGTLATAERLPINANVQC